MVTNALNFAQEDSIIAAAKARNAFVTADRDEILGLKHTLHGNALLVKRSNVYRTHLKFTKFLAKRLLSWNSDLRARTDAGELDEVDLLRYGTCCFQFMTAASQLAIMNQRGIRAKERCEDRYDAVSNSFTDHFTAFLDVFEPSGIV